MPTKQQIYQRVVHVSGLEKRAIEAMQERYDKMNDENKFKDTTEKEKPKDEKKDKENKKSTNDKDNSKKDALQATEKHFDVKKMADLFKVKLKVVNSGVLNKQDNKLVGYYESMEQK